MKKGPAPKIVSLPIQDIANRFDVRKELDEDNIIRLAELYQNNVDLPPIQVTLINGVYCYVDGRHRAQARLMLDMPTIDCEIVTETDTLQLYADALRANYGGAKPPTRADIEHTIKCMVEAGARETHIKAKLDFLPAGVIRVYMNTVKSSINKRRMAAALDAITEGMTLVDSAEKYGLEIDALKDALQGKKKRFGGSQTGFLTDSINAITTTLKSSTAVIAGRMKVLFGKVEDGEATIETAARVLDHWESKATQSLHRIKDWRERLRAISSRKDELREEFDTHE